LRIAKRLTALVGTFVLTAVLFASQALAGPYPPKEPPEEVLPTVVFPAQPAEAGEGSLAFTGAELSLLFVVLAVLVVAGVAALMAGRRRGFGDASA